MPTGTTIFKLSDAKFVELEGLGSGSAASARFLSSDDSSSLRTGLSRMKNVSIPRRARVEEVLHVISGSIEVEDQGKTQTVVQGDSILLTADAAPTYHVKDEAVILWAMTSLPAVS